MEPTRIPIDAEFDLHSFASADLESVLDEYLRAAALAGLRDVRIVHGRGRGARRAHVQAILDKHPLVESFSDDGRSHLGATWVRIASARA